MTIACIGAGIAGLSAARQLEANGHDVRLFDKGRGAGGRLSTRRANTPVGEVRFDHGAQFFTARSDGFRALVDTLITEGALARWTPETVKLSIAGDDWAAAPSGSGLFGDARYVGTPAMNSVIKALCEGQDVVWGERATTIEPRSDGVHIQLEPSGWAGPFETVIVAVPAEQAAELLQSVCPALAEEAKSATTAPCWSAMLAFARPVDVDWDAGEVESGPLGWIARNSSKPGRDSVETWVLQATPEWSRENLSASADEIAAVLMASFREMTGAPAPDHAAAHRWLLARTETPAGSPFGWDEAARIATVGDWRIAPRVEAAWESGTALASFLGVRI
jgi:predicted NAD/FAD-dependent oxidoreductase